MNHPTVRRLEGGEFSLIIRGIASPGRTGGLADKLLKMTILAYFLLILKKMSSRSPRRTRLCDGAFSLRGGFCLHTRGAGIE
jgi:hypothetical protein